MEENNPEAPAPTKKSVFTPFIPTPGYFITPILININVLIWLAMVLSGVNVLSPTSDDLLLWGANMRSLTMGGEWWRMFTAMFLHYGILHLAFNMFALYSIGNGLEPFIGKWRLFILYFCAGIGGNAVSLWWHDSAAGAGASGAIFGTFGIFAALLTTDLIDKSVRMDMLKSMGSAIAINLFIGLSGNIDNSAHIGGLLTGAIGGYLVYFDLKAWYYHRKKQITFLLAAVALTIAITFTLWKITPPAINLKSIYNELINETNSAIASYSRNNFATSPVTISKQQVEKFERCIALSDSIMHSRDLSRDGKKTAAALAEYARNMTRASQYWYRAITENNSSFVDSAAPFEHKAENIMSTINKQNDAGGISH